MSFFSSISSFFGKPEVNEIVKSEGYTIDSHTGDELTEGLNQHIYNLVSGSEQTQYATYPSDSVYGATALTPSEGSVIVGGNNQLPAAYFHNTHIQNGGSIVAIKCLKKLTTNNRVKLYCKKLNITPSKKNVNKVKSVITSVSILTLQSLKEDVKNKDKLIGKKHIQKLNKKFKSKH
jgi:hypothetical protein